MRESCADPMLCAPHLSAPVSSFVKRDDLLIFSRSLLAWRSVNSTLEGRAAMADAWKKLNSF